MTKRKTMSMPWLIPRLLVSWKLVGINYQDTQISTTEIDKKKCIDHIN